MPPAPEPAEPEVLVERTGALGRLILNRPRAINALTHPMVTAVSAALNDWLTDDSVQTVLLTGAGERGLCAGGDVVGFHRTATGGDQDGAFRFWADEYRMDAQIARYPKPFVSIQHGVVLGGGIGISAHARHRVVTDGSTLGMPEVTIGFVPDVGGLYLLSRAPGELGTHLALTGSTVGPADAIQVGLSDRFVPAGRLEALTEALADGQPAGAAIQALAAEPPPGTLAQQRDWIDEAYRGDDAREVLARLEASPVSAARDAAALIRTKSPTAVAITLVALRRAAALPTLEHVLDQDNRVATRVLTEPDFAEGIRAQVIDKDRNPRWRPEHMPAPGEVARFFEPVADELGLAGVPAEPVNEGSAG